MTVMVSLVKLFMSMAMQMKSSSMRSRVVVELASKDQIDAYIIKS